jgi:hypothetical protein
MALITNPQTNLPLGLAKSNVSLPEQTQVEVIAALADVILHLWEINIPTDKALENKIDE